MTQELKPEEKERESLNICEKSITDGRAAIIKAATQSMWRGCGAPGRQTGLEQSD